MVLGAIHALAVLIMAVAILVDLLAFVLPIHAPAQSSLVVALAE